MFEDIHARLKGKVVIMGIGNCLRSDDAAGSLLAQRIKEKVPFVVFDAGVAPENFLEKIVKERPDTVMIIDAVDFKGKPGESRLFDAQDLKTANLFSTHNSSITLLFNYLHYNLEVDIIALFIQPKTIVFGDTVSREVEETLVQWENLFSRIFRQSSK